MKGATIYHRGDRRFTVWQARLRDEMPGADGTENPMLWWCEEITNSRERDWVYAGAPRLKDVMAAIDEVMDGGRN